MKKVKYIFCMYRAPKNFHCEQGKTVFIINPKEYWETYTHIWTKDYPNKVMKILNDLGFIRDYKSYFSSELSQDEIRKKLNKYPQFEEDKEFLKYCEDHILR